MSTVLPSIQMKLMHMNIWDVYTMHVVIVVRIPTKKILKINVEGSKFIDYKNQNNFQG